MIQRYCEIIFWTSDMNRSLTWYRDKLGMKVLEESSQWSTMIPPEVDPATGPVLGIMATTDGAPVPFVPPGPNGVQQGAIVTFTVPNLTEAISKYEHKGIEVQGDIYELPGWGRCVMYYDPDKNAIMIVELYEKAESC